MESMTEIKYWRITRPAHKLFLNFVWALPRSVIYWAVIRAAGRVEPNGDPSNVTAVQMLKAWEKRN